MDIANSHTKSYNIPRSFEVMYKNIKYKLSAWVTCEYTDSRPLQTTVKYMESLSV